MGGGGQKTKTTKDIMVFIHHVPPIIDQNTASENFEKTKLLFHKISHKIYTICKINFQATRKQRKVEIGNEMTNQTEELQ